MKYFVHPDSIVRKIWGKADTILFIFAGAAAEFSLNKEVDWLYFTGRLPADPIGRLFSTVSYAKQIIFSEEEKALASIDRMGMIHSGVEANRGYRIPDEAYRDVLFMLIHYSIAAFELLERELTSIEKQEVLNVFHRVGTRMNIPHLPSTYRDWIAMHNDDLKKHLIKSNYTQDLYAQYKKHLGSFRYNILLKVQSKIVPETALNLLSLKPSKSLPAMLWLYKCCRKVRMDAMLKSLLLPTEYKDRIEQLNYNV
jgi:hypothetical protein